MEFAGVWNGVDMERRSQVKDFEHTYPVNGSARIEIINDKEKIVQTADNVRITDEKLSITVPSGKLETQRFH